MENSVVPMANPPVARAKMASWTCRRFVLGGRIVLGGAVREADVMVLFRRRMDERADARRPLCPMACVSSSLSETLDFLVVEKNQYGTANKNENSGTRGLQQIVGGAIVDVLTVPSRLLVARRSAPEQFAGMWEFPGGKVEAGEEDCSALVRELLEELGVGVRLGNEIAGPLEQGWPLNPHAAMRVWQAQIDTGVAEPLQDHDQLRWMELTDPAAILALQWIPADLPIVRELLRTLGC